MHILFAEDQELGRFFLSSHLRSMGHKVTEAADGKQALDLLAANQASKDEPIGMLITDWDMPVMNGLELAIQARKACAANYLYIILVTGKGDSSNRVQGFAEGGVDDYIVKPFEMDEVKLRVEVGRRLVEAERSLREYSTGLERIVHKQTQAIRDAQNEVISRLFNALQSRDSETGAHVRRIGVMSAYIANLIGWPTVEINQIRGAAPLHDVGKIGISDTVLLKPGPLTIEERTLMEEHAAIGASILKGSVSPMIQMAERIAFSHHENWDGSGYPLNIAGEKIPMEARIVSIVDVYDALRSNRVYREGIDENTVLEMMLEQKGTKFDPELLDIFMRNLPKIHEILSSLDLDDDISKKTLGSESFEEDRYHAC